MIETLHRSVPKAVPLGFGEGGRGKSLSYSIRKATNGYSYAPGAQRPDVGPRSLETE